MSALFGPSGNAQRFYDEGHKKTMETFAWLKANGLDAFEYPAGNGITGSLDTFMALGQEAARQGIRTSFHAPYFISLSGTDPEKRLKSIDYIRKSDEMARALGADILVIHTGSAAKISREEAVALAKDTIFKTLEAIPDSSVAFGLETMGKINQLGTLEEVLSICRMDARLRPVVDFGHMNARARGGLFNTADDYRRVFDTIATELDPDRANTLHCHFSKIEFTDAGEKRHLTFADTRFGPPFEPLMEAIVKDGLSPRIISESAGTQADDALAMKTYYQSMLSAANSPRSND